MYELDGDLKPIASPLAVEPLKFGRYLGDAEKIKAAAEAVKNQTKVGSRAHRERILLVSARWAEAVRDSVLPAIPLSSFSMVQVLLTGALRAVFSKLSHALQATGCKKRAGNRSTWRISDLSREGLRKPRA